jgi:predicted transcriptional regulator of viral defense system
VNVLRDYAYPRDKISDLLAKGVIVRVKKGLYVFGDDYRNRPYSREILANLIYGPSCVSLEYALHQYGLIPERVEAVTSVTTKRPKEFRTPVGLFKYHNIPEAGFHFGLQRMELSDGRAYLIASPEKALADKFRSDRGLYIRTRKGCLDYLENSLRIEPGDLAALDAELLDKIATAYASKRIRLLVDSVKYLQKGTG